MFIPDSRVCILWISLGLTRALVLLLFNRTNSLQSASLVCLGGVFQAHHYGQIFKILSKKYFSFLLSKSIKSRIIEWKNKLQIFCCKFLKFIYSEKATKFCEMFTLLLTTVHTVKSKVKISQNFVAFSE